MTLSAAPEFTAKSWNPDSQRFFLECEVHRSGLLAYAKHLTGSKWGAEAEDLVQDTIIKGVVNRSQFQPNTNLRRWLFTILRNGWFNTCRKTKRTVLFGNMEAANINDNEGIDPLEKSMDSKINADIEAIRIKCEVALSDLSSLSVENLDLIINEFLHINFPQVFIDAYLRVNKDHRVVFALSDILDFEYVQIGQMLGIPNGTVMSQLFRGRNALSRNPGIIDSGSFYGLMRKEGKRTKTK